MTAPLSTRLSNLARLLADSGRATLAGEVRRLVADVRAIEADVGALARMAEGVAASAGDLSDIACASRELAAEQMTPGLLVVAEALGVRAGAVLRPMVRARPEEEKPGVRVEEVAP